MAILKGTLSGVPPNRKTKKSGPKQAVSWPSESKHQRVIELLSVLPAKEKKLVVDILGLMHQDPEVGQSLEVLRKAHAQSRKNHRPIALILVESFQSVAFEKQRQLDPLAAARERGAHMRTELLNAHGGTMSSDEVAQLLQLTRQAVEARRRAGRLLAYPLEGPRYRYPRWQFGDDGQVLPGLERVLSALETMSAWGKGSFMTSGDVRLDGDTPLERLRRGEIKKVVWAADAYGEQLAT